MEMCSFLLEFLSYVFIECVCLCVCVYFILLHFFFHFWYLRSGTNKAYHRQNDYGIRVETKLMKKTEKRIAHRNETIVAKIIIPLKVKLYSIWHYMRDTVTHQHFHNRFHLFSLSTLPYNSYSCITFVATISIKNWTSICVIFIPKCEIFRWTFHTCQSHLMAVNYIYVCCIDVRYDWIYLHSPVSDWLNHPLRFSSSHRITLNE